MSRTLLARLLALIALTSSAAACKSGPELEDCRRMCWNYHEVMFWAKVDLEVKDMTPEDAAKHRAQRELDFKAEQAKVEDPGHLNCITNCRQALDPEEARCLQAAKTPDGLQSCTDKWEVKPLESM